MARQLIETMEIDWAPETYRDEFRDDLLALVKKRAKEGEDAEVAEAPEAPEPTRIIDLVAALKRSIEEGPKAESTRSPKARSGRVRRKSA